MRFCERAVVATASVLCLCLWSGIAYADPVQWPAAEGGNDHWYEIISAPGLNWHAAEDAAWELTWEIEPGVSEHAYLGTVTSAAENDWLAEHIYPVVDSAIAWLGGFQDPNDPDYAEPDGGWKWVTGEDWSYANWAPGEPNDVDGEAYLWVYLRPVDFAMWNDHDPDSYGMIEYYLAEFDSEYVPEPSALSLLMLGCAVALRRRR